jgi:hypothetical protein
MHESALIFVPSATFGQLILQARRGAAIAKAWLKKIRLKAGRHRVDLIGKTVTAQTHFLLHRPSGATSKTWQNSGRLTCFQRQDQTAANVSRTEHFALKEGSI